MQFMILMIPAVYRNNPSANQDFKPGKKDMEEMERFNEDLAREVKLLSLNGLHPLSKGARVCFGQGRPTVTEGARVETTEVLGGYWLVEADSKEQLVGLMQKCPAQEGDTIEIRQIFSAEDFAG